MTYLTPSFLRESRYVKISKKGRYLRDGGYKKRKITSPKVKIFKKGRFIPKEYSF